MNKAAQWCAAAESADIWRAFKQRQKTLKDFQKPDRVWVTDARAALVVFVLVVAILTIGG